jgi:activator of 2-hydroxyglutaryl-CoA dehydratase
VYHGLDDLNEFITSGRKAKLGDSPGRPCPGRTTSSMAFREQYKIPKFQPAPAHPRLRVRAVIGMDGGSTSSKAVLVDEARTSSRRSTSSRRATPSRT